MFRLVGLEGGSVVALLFRQGGIANQAIGPEVGHLQISNS
jgi:hypothetical protein